MSVRASLLGISVDEMTSAEAVETIRGIWRRGAKSRVFFVNAHCFNTAAMSVAYRESLREAEFVLPDGSGVLMASRLLHVPIQHNLNGTDLTPMLCRAAAQDGRSIFLLGARPGIAEKVGERLQKRFPALRIVGMRHGYFKPEQSAEVVAEINAARPDMLLVAMGVPMQELWITDHFAELDVPVCLAVGALFDFLSNSVPRAPRLLRKLGVEWLYRLYREPRRLWKRYLLGNATFLSRVFASRMGMRPKTARPAMGTYVVPASGILLAAPQRATAPAPYSALPIPQRGNLRWSGVPERKQTGAAAARSGVRVAEAAQREPAGVGERVPTSVRQ